LKEKETNNTKSREQKREPKHLTTHYDAQPVFKRKCLLCGSTEHLLSQCSMKDSFNNWKESEQSKLKDKEDEKLFSFKEKYNAETEEKIANDNNSF